MEIISIFSIDDKFSNYEDKIKKNAKLFFNYLNKKNIINPILLDNNTSKKAKKNIKESFDIFVDIFLCGNDIVPTNVLSFPNPKDFPHPEYDGIYLGEIYLNPDYIKEHEENFDHMLLHGILHLLGFDHEKRGERLKMEGLEKDILKQLESLKK